MTKYMKGERKLAHDYYLDCCKKYGVEVVSDRQVRSHYETVIRFDGMETKQISLSIFGLSICGQGYEKKTGMTAFCVDMASMYAEAGNISKYDEWDKLILTDILCEPKPEKHPLVAINDLLIKAWEIADKSVKEDVSDALLDAINNALAEVNFSRSLRGV